jgi:hypothetical protein
MEGVVIEKYRFFASHKYGIDGSNVTWSTLDDPGVKPKLLDLIL